jgi:hypothetical protein
MRRRRMRRRKTKKNLRQCSSCRDRDSNRTPPEYCSRTLPLHQIARLLGSVCRTCGTLNMKLTVWREAFSNPRWVKVLQIVLQWRERGERRMKCLLKLFHNKKLRHFPKEIGKSLLSVGIDRTLHEVSRILTLSLPSSVTVTLVHNIFI